MLLIHCLNTAKMLFTDCPLVNMKCYSLAKVVEGIDQYLSDEPHNEKLILGEAYVAEYRSNRDKLLGKVVKEKEKPGKPEKKRKKVEPPNGIGFKLGSNKHFKF